jgi:hypothetical protein
VYGGRRCRRERWIWVVLFALLLHEIHRTVDGQGEDDLVQELRDTLRIGNNLGNHVFYAGHLIELSGFAQRDGFALTETHASAVVFVLDEMNRTLDEWLAACPSPTAITASDPTDVPPRSGGARTGPRRAARARPGRSPQLRCRVGGCNPSNRSGSAGRPAAGLTAA